MSQMERDAEHDLGSMRAEISSLKNQVAGMAGRAARMASDSASDIYNTVSDRSRHTLELTAEQVRQRPLLWIGGAFAVGYIASRIFRSRG